MFTALDAALLIIGSHLTENGPVMESASQPCSRLSKVASASSTQICQIRPSTVAVRHRQLSAVMSSCHA